jgi:hypothetical protein
MRHTAFHSVRYAGLLLVLTLAACSRQPASTASEQPASAGEKSSAAADVATASPPALAPGTGWIEGTLTDGGGTPPVVAGSLGVPVVLKAEGKDVQSATNPTGGGFFSFRNLKPGVYELFIESAHHPDNSDPLRPVHVSGVVVEAGKRTVLNVKMEPGKELQELGKPAMTTQKVVLVSEELERLQAQIDELKKK